MCTSIRYKNNDTYFGRNLDVEFSFCEQVAITPRNRLFRLRNGKDFRNKFGLVGIAAVVSDYPLYYEAANEKGLAAAGLNFPSNAVYKEPENGYDNIAPFEFLPYVLGSASDVEEARKMIEKINLTNIKFAGSMPLSPLHFMFGDSEKSIVAEPTADGIKIYDDPFDVMTNNPTFDYHIQNMRNYMNLSPENAENRFSKKYELKDFGVGMGAVGLPGDASSASRFVRAAFNLTNAVSDGTEGSNVSEFFHILDSVAMVKGAVITNQGKNDITLYSCCINLSKGIFYYKTYDNSQITAVKLTDECLDSEKLTVFPLRKSNNIYYEN